MNMEVALMTHSKNQQIKLFPTCLNSNTQKRINHYHMPYNYKPLIILFTLITSSVTTTMSTNPSQNESDAHSQPDQSQTKTDLHDCCLVGRWLSNKPI